MKFLFLNITRFTLLLIIYIFSTIAFTQQITTDNSLSVQNLIENNLASGCVEISNVSSTINGSVNNLNSFGLFNRNGSTFPFESGIILTTGETNKAGNTPSTAIISNGTNAWGTDPDLENALGLNNTLNATSIEFDFISGTDSIQFNYIFASEEYFGNNPCNFSDSFVFLIKETDSFDPFTNIAIIPSTTIPVNTTTVHDEITGDDGCSAVNDNYFFGPDSSTNYNGRTVTLTAGTNIKANVFYTIKLIIADSRFSDYDSAVFIEANSFNNTVDLGTKISTCESTVTLDGTVASNNATYEWSLNGTKLPNFGNNMPIISVNNSGTYTVDVSIPLNGSTCTFSDDIVVSLNNVETGPILKDIQLCDDASNDEIENFNFTQAKTELLELLQPETYTISYHFINTQAVNGSNPITNPTNFPNTINPQVIHVRAENTLGCIYITSFSLVINPFPVITDPTTFFACTNDNGANLNTINNDITQGNTSYNVTYHSSQTDADSNSNPLTIPYIPSTSPEQVFIRVTTPTECFTTADVNIITNDNPVINTEPQQIDACTTNSFASFDITSVEADILNGLDLTNITISYHANNLDADTGFNPIPDPTNYTNIIAEEQNVYIRIVDDLTDCFTVHEIELHTLLLYTGTLFTVTPEAPVLFFECDLDLDDNVEFNLNDVASDLLDDLNDDFNIQVQFYENNPLINASEPVIDSSIPYLVTTTGTPLYVTLTKVNPDCVYNNQIMLNINEGVLIHNLTAQDYCDSDDDLSSITIENFNYFNTYLETVTEIQPLNYTYFASQADAENNISQLPTNYVVNTPTTPYSVYFRATNSSDCFNIGELEINFLPAPSINVPTNIFVCTTDGSITATVNLEDKIDEINNELGFVFTFHTSMSDANTGTANINTPDAYTTATRTIYTRVENKITGCYAIQAFEVIVNNKPNVMINDYVVCLPIGSTTGDFFFESEIDHVILNTSLSSPVTISYYEMYDSTTSTLSMPINKTIAHQNTTASDTIYVLIEYVNDSNCSTITDFQINVGEIPDYNSGISTYSICDNDINNDGIAVFDLSGFSDQLEQGSSQTLNITYYLDENNALSKTNPISNINNFTNTLNPQTIYYNVDNGTICDGVAGFELQVAPIPVGVTPTPITICDVNTDGFMPFNITNIESDILTNITARAREDIIINYYPSQEDFNNNTNLIFTSNPNNIQSFPDYINISNPQTLIVQILNTASACFDTVELELIVETPPVLNPNQVFEICNNDLTEFNLSTTTTNLIDTQTNIVLEFYESQINAETQTDALTNTYVYTTASTTLWVRANFNESNCFNIESFILNINNLPTANNLPNLETCDDDYDFLQSFDLSTQTPFILGGQNPANFTISYYNTQEDADNKTSPITNLNIVSKNNEDYFIRIENNTTNCYNTSSFNTIVHRKPFIELNDVPLCLKNLPLVVTAETGFPTDTYLWNSGQTTAEINITTVGSYSVTITTQNNCMFTASFVVEESEAADIEFTETVDFSDPNSITVTISGIGDYLYQLDDGQPQESNFFNNVSLGLHLITVIDQNGCNSVSKEVIVFDIPLFFTPNNDGYKDTWHIAGVGQLQGTIVYIFDRYGKLLKSLSYTSAGWDGNYNGHRMPANDYWYVAKIKHKGEELEKKGHFTLRR